MPEQRRESADAERLDDEEDRSELRARYYGLMQELRVVVTGVQVLLAFLLTVPFAQGFTKLDNTQRAWFGAGLVCATISVIAFVTPTAMHRYGKRTARADRLSFSIVAARVGLVFLAGAILISFSVVVSFLYSGSVALMLIVGIGTILLSAWILIPLLTYITDRDDPERRRTTRP